MRHRRNMRREFISDAELMSKVREEGLEYLDKVRGCPWNPMARPA